MLGFGVLHRQRVFVASVVVMVSVIVLAVGVVIRSFVAISASAVVGALTLGITVYRLHESIETSRNNEAVIEELDDYRRLMHVLDDAGVSFAEMLDLYGVSPHVVLVARDRDAATLREVEDDSEPSLSTFVSGVDPIRVDDYTWLIPPVSVPDSVVAGDESAVDALVADPDAVAYAWWLTSGESPLTTTPSRGSCSRRRRDTALATSSGNWRVGALTSSST